MERKGVSIPYTSMNGNMYTMLRKDAVLGIRLSKEDGNAFMEEYKSKPFENYGSLIKEYVEVPSHVFMDTELMSKYMNMTHQYGKTLKPKPTKKKKESKAKSKTAEEKKVTWLIGETYKNGR